MPLVYSAQQLQGVNQTSCKILIPSLLWSHAETKTKNETGKKVKHFYFITIYFHKSKVIIASSFKYKWDVRILILILIYILILCKTFLLGHVQLDKALCYFSLTTCITSSTIHRSNWYFLWNVCNLETSTENLHFGFSIIISQAGSFQM